MSPGSAALLASIVLNALAQLSVKVGADKLDEVRKRSPFETALNAFLHVPWIPAGLALYGLSFVFWAYTLSKHDLSFAYPVVSIGYVLVFILSWLVLKEDISA